MKMGEFTLENGVKVGGMELDEPSLPMVIPMMEPTDTINDMGPEHIAGMMEGYMPVDFMPISGKARGTFLFCFHWFTSTDQLARGWHRLSTLIHHGHPAN